MTFAEALVYAANFAQQSHYGAMRAYCAVLRLRGVEMPLDLDEQNDAAAAMLAEFKAFDPRGAPDGR